MARALAKKAPAQAAAPAGKKITSKRAAQVEEAEVEEVEENSGRGRGKYKHDMVITMHVDYNPKRRNTESYDRFELYEDGMTVEDALAAGITSGDFNWDVAHDLITIGDEYDDSIEKRSKPVKEVAEESDPDEAPARSARKGAAKKAAKKSRKAADDEEEEEEEVEEE